MVTPLAIENALKADVFSFGCLLYEVCLRKFNFPDVERVYLFLYIVSFISHSQFLTGNIPYFECVDADSLLAKLRRSEGPICDADNLLANCGGADVERVPTANTLWQLVVCTCIMI